ncbi:MAG: LPS assembly lipoprotein LptE [Pseudomonadota bacterium]
MWLPKRFSLFGLALLITACGFEPVYGPSGGGRVLQNTVLVDEPSEQRAYLLTREIEERLGRSDTPRYALSLDIMTDQQGLAIDREGNIDRFNLIGTVNYALRDLTNGQIATSGTVSSFTSFSGTGTTVVSLAGEQDARERLMTILADQIVTRLYAANLTR